MKLVSKVGKNIETNYLLRSIENIDSTESTFYTISTEQFKQSQILIWRPEMEVGVKTIGENIINKLPDKRPYRVLTQLRVNVDTIYTDLF